MTRLIIDTDVALGVWHKGRPRDIDDGFAIVEAINSPLIDLVGITCVYGNGPIDEVFRVANEIVDLKEANVPVTPGAAGPMADNADTNPAVEYLADALRKERLTIAAIGPLTNIALLIRHHRDVIDQIDQLIVVAGRSPGREFYIGDAGPVQDFNFENDVEAARVVMDSGIDCVLMGFELTSQVCVTREDLETIASRGNSTASYFYENSVAWCDYWTDTFPEDTGFHPWDSATIAWLLNPDWFLHEQRGCAITEDPPRFDCGPDISGPQHTYCYGFEANGDRSFVDAVTREVY